MGPWIESDGKRPDWLGDANEIEYITNYGSNFLCLAKHIATTWEAIAKFRLRDDHFAYKAFAQGFMPWNANGQTCLPPGKYQLMMNLFYSDHTTKRMSDASSDEWFGRVDPHVIGYETKSELPRLSGNFATADYADPRFTNEEHKKATDRFASPIDFTRASFPSKPNSLAGLITDAYTDAANLFRALTEKHFPDVESAPAPTLKEVIAQIDHITADLVRPGPPPVDRDTVIKECLTTMSRLQYSISSAAHDKIRADIAAVISDWQTS